MPDLPMYQAILPSFDLPRLAIKQLWQEPALRRAHRRLPLRSRRWLATSRRIDKFSIDPRLLQLALQEFQVASVRTKEDVSHVTRNRHGANCRVEQEVAH